MSWLNTSIANLAKNALKEAQKTIDKALDIRDTDASQTQDLIEGRQELKELQVVPYQKLV